MTSQRPPMTSQRPHIPNPFLSVYSQCWPPSVGRNNMILGQNRPAGDLQLRYDTSSLTKMSNHCNQDDVNTMDTFRDIRNTLACQPNTTFPRRPNSAEEGIGGGIRRVQPWNHSYNAAFGSSVQPRDSKAQLYSKLTSGNSTPAAKQNFTLPGNMEQNITLPGNDDEATDYRQALETEFRYLESRIREARTTLQHNQGSFTTFLPKSPAGNRVRSKSAERRRPQGPGLYRTQLAAGLSVYRNQQNWCPGDAQAVVGIQLCPIPTWTPPRSTETSCDGINQFERSASSQSHITDTSTVVELEQDPEHHVDIDNEHLQEHAYPTTSDNNHRRRCDSATSNIVQQQISNLKNVSVRKEKVQTLCRSTSCSSGLNCSDGIYGLYSRIPKGRHGNLWTRLSDTVNDLKEMDTTGILAIGVVGTELVEKDERKTKTDPNAYAPPLSERMMRLDLLKLSRSDKDWRTLTGIRPKDPIEELIIERLIKMERLQTLTIELERCWAKPKPPPTTSSQLQPPRQPLREKIPRTLTSTSLNLPDKKVAVVLDGLNANQSAGDNNCPIRKQATPTPSKFCSTERNGECQELSIFRQNSLGTSTTPRSRPALARAASTTVKLVAESPINCNSNVVKQPQNVKPCEVSGADILTVVDNNTSNSRMIRVQGQKSHVDILCVDNEHSLNSQCPTPIAFKQDVDNRHRFSIVKKISTVSLTLPEETQITKVTKKRVKSAIKTSRMRTMPIRRPDTAE